MSTLIDFSQVTFAAVAAMTKHKAAEETDLKNLVKHSFFTSLLSHTRKWRRDHGELIIVTDSSSWRKQFFPAYKIMRKKAREDSPIDWAMAIETMSELKTDLAELGFPVISVQGAEADDIIAVAARQTYFGTTTMVVSGDKDFAQLHNIEGVQQFSPYTKKPIVIENPELELIKLILSGDDSDSIPNVLTPDDFYERKFAGEKVRQKPIRDIDSVAKNILSQRVVGGTTIEHAYPYWDRNETLISFDRIPPEIVANIKDELSSKKSAKLNKNKLRMYFADRKMRLLMETVAEF